jgi:predicted nuclease of predicted toxin-antitoxin system
MKVLVDMNLTPDWVHFFQENGIDAVHWSNIGKPNAPDSEILDYAASGKFVIFTHDLDFGVILAARKSRIPSVIQVRTEDVLPSRIGDVLLYVLEVARTHLQDGAIVTVDPAQHRIRLLPI